MVSRLLISVMVILGMLITGCSKATYTNSDKGKTSKEAKTELYVFAAASLNNVLTEIQGRYQEENTEVNLIFNFNSSGTLKTQIEEGAQCDIFFSAGKKQMDELEVDGYIIADSKVNLLENSIVLIKPKGTQTKVTGFENVFEAKNIALAAEDVPVGAYAREVFTNLGILEKVEQMEINEVINVTAALAAVSEASNEVGVVYATDAYSVKDSVEIIAEAPSDSFNSQVVYPVGLVKNQEASTKQQEESERFLDYLCSKETLAVFEAYGFKVHKE